MSAREAILQSVRRNRPAESPLPSLDEAWTTYDDRRAQFVAMLESIGGLAIGARDCGEADEKVRRLPQYVAAKKVVSLVPGVGAANIDLARVGSPHALADVDVAILLGQFGVAENAAVWVTDEGIAHRGVFFLCQHLILVVPAHEIVDNMHAAYERLVGPASPGGQDVPLGSRHLPGFSEPMFGEFIAGPSKTADIEQSMVIGAHGPRSLTVCLVGASNG